MTGEGERGRMEGAREKTMRWSKLLKGEGAVCAAGLLWGTAGVWVKALEEAGLGALQVVALRIWGAAAVFAAVAAATKGGRGLFRVRAKDLWCFAGTGVVSVTGFSWCYFETIRTSSLALAAVLLYTAPVFVMLFSLWLFGERMTWRKGVACAMAMGGVALTAGFAGGEPVTWRALGTGLLSGVGYALYSIFGRAAINRGYSARAIALWTFLCAAAALALVAEPGSWVAAARAGGARTALAAALLPFAATLLPYVLYTRGLESVSNGKASVLAFAEPLTACVLGVAVLGQAMSAEMACGVALVFAALVGLVGAKEG